MASKNKSFLSAVEWLALIFAIFFSHFIAVYFTDWPFNFDEDSYIHAGKNICDNGLFSKFHFSELRTYAYPAFLAVIKKVAGLFTATPFKTRWPVFYAQLFLYLTVAFTLRHLIKNRLGRPDFARWAFCIFCLNIFNLIYLPFALTENLSTALLMVSLVSILAFPIFTHDEFRSSVWSAFWVGSLVGICVMLRPGNVVLIPAAVVLGFFQWFFWKNKISLPRFGLFALGVLVFIAPQFRNNVFFYKRFTPLTAADLGSSQITWGLRYIKYATSIQPTARDNQIFYVNPFWKKDTVESQQHPFRIYNRYPLIYLRTTFIHLFGLLDQDLAFPYNKSIVPWYRWPTSILSLTLCLLGVVALVTAMIQGFRRKTIFSSQCDFTFKFALTATTFALCYLMLYAHVAVEGRYGFPIIAVLSFCIFFFKDSVVGGPLNKKKTWMVPGGLVVLAFGLLLSHWIQLQAPEIQYERGKLRESRSTKTAWIP
jgi:hypothetical protein